jgi:uncharacterized protein involved in exopolysaccharide biosynthesis
MDAVNGQQVHGDEISLRELLEVLWQGRWLAACITAVCALLAVVAVWLAPTKYTAVVVLSPASEGPGSSQLGKVSSLASQLGGIASLAGISMTGDLKRAESIAVLQSAALTQKYLQDNDLLPVLYEKKWDAKGKRWNEPDPQKVPTLWKANEDFRENIRAVKTDTKSGLVTMTITWTDPQLAAQWANGLVKMTNDYLRAKAIDQVERNIAYLNEQANKTDVVAVKTVIYSILETEINTAMLARGSDEYAFKVIDPAAAPETSASPNPKLWIAGGIIAGLFLSVLAAFARVAWARG